MLTMDQCYESPEGASGNGLTLCLLSWLQRSSAGDELGLRLKQEEKSLPVTQSWHGSRIAPASHKKTGFKRGTAKPQKKT